MNVRKNLVGVSSLHLYWERYSLLRCTRPVLPLEQTFQPSGAESSKNIQPGTIQTIHGESHFRIDSRPDAQGNEINTPADAYFRLF